MPLDSKVTTEWPREGVALITVTDNTVPGFNFITWASVDALGVALKGAREKGARVIVLASGVEGHWLGHANLGDLK
jgi:enoyl-CoA hydratase/carnithine racemase